jgi:hypothetical protein
MKKLTIATMTLAFAASGLALPFAANAAAVHPDKHKHPAKSAPCGGKVVGIDIALGSTNICIPL